MALSVPSKDVVMNSDEMKKVVSRCYKKERNDDPVEFNESRRLLMKALEEIELSQVARAALTRTFIYLSFSSVNSTAVGTLKDLLRPKKNVFATYYNNIGARVKLKVFFGSNETLVFCSGAIYYQNCILIDATNSAPPSQGNATAI